MCGIIGVSSYDDCATELFLGMNALQHRGQDASGIVTFSGHFRLVKGNGLVSQVFDAESLEGLPGKTGLGHVRYATQGTLEPAMAQPFYMNYPFGIAMVHNGNVDNSGELAAWLHDEQYRLIETTNDLELILYAFASELEKKPLPGIGSEDIFDAVGAVQRRVQGAYAVIALIAGKGLLGFKDPYGIRPLFLGKRTENGKVAWAFASETSCLEMLGYEIAKELAGGDAVLIDTDGNVQERHFSAAKPGAFCVFEYIYFAREDSSFCGSLVAEAREAMGKSLAKRFKERGLEPDVVIDVPTSAEFFAQGLADELGIPYRRGFVKNKYVGRSFIKPTQAERSRTVRLKLNPIPSVVRGKKVAVVDDSIVRGTTSKRIVELLRQAGAAKIYCVSAAPPLRFPCVYGIDMSVKTELIAGAKSLDEVAAFIGADELIYQSLEDVEACFPGVGLCSACFSGVYPTGISPESIERIERDRIAAKKAG
jgi:amidophosphoribosyltransferase